MQPDSTDILDDRREVTSAEAPPAPAAIPPAPTAKEAPSPRGWSGVRGYRDDGQSVSPIDDSGPAASAAQGQPSLAIPLLAQDRLLGVLEFGPHETGRPWTEDDRLLAEAAAQQLALALYDARTYQITQQALEDMREADRLKTQFLANMSHELRTPLNSIIGFSRVILKGIDGPISDTQAQDLTAIYNSGQHLLGLINDILDLSRIEAGKMELAFSEVDLGEIVRSVMSTAVGLVKDKPIELEVDVPDSLPILQGDPIRIRQVLLNLISNATKFTEKGKVGASARVQESNGRREILVSVFDTGSGIAAEDQVKLFEPFSQVDASPTRKTGGTGLGLSICRHLVELHRGKIWVESRTGEGSTFLFTLPIEAGVEAAALASQPLVLVIAEEAEVLEAYRHALTGKGFRFHTVSKPQESYAIAREIRPAAIVLDPLLAGGAGWQVLASLKASPDTRTIPVVMCRADHKQDKAVNLAAIDLLARPLREEDLLAASRRLRPAGKPQALALVVSDQAAERQRIRGILENRGEFNVSEAQNAQAGLEAIHTQAPDLLLLDITLAASEALDLLERLREDPATRRLPLVILIGAALGAEQVTELTRRTSALVERTNLGVAQAIDEAAQCVAALVASAGGKT